MFDREFRYFIEHQDDLVARHRGKILVLVGEEVVGVYETPLQAYVEESRKRTLGTFMIQRCIPGPDAYTITLANAYA